ncbi:SRPBCC domain-containing protein [Falsigemmobacter faecalis]|uniref:Polyketide cyclase n=1 Tax=Falsigemmobacter faecalis TaxID=2488730 RepID=A0A3P3DPJ7_9RHOB|nr:SRPBCC domain-containing protein [Falsigemmobacter faecalis]RRH75854.1 polyketide cyclase [Falsigemmobacter faecalis]
MEQARDLSFEVALACTPAAAWRCWTEAELLKRFFAPEPGRTEEAVIDPVPGGRFYTKMVFAAHGEIRGEGCILHVEPGRRLVFTDSLSAGWRPNREGFFTADLRFVPGEAGGCLYRVTARHADGAAAERHAQMGFVSGWTQVARQLERVAQTLKA